jgi:hypothetical protein
MREFVRRYKVTDTSDQPFEAVFYSEPVPSSMRTLAILALVFDRVHFPGVYIAERVDAEATAAELDRIAQLERSRRVGNAQMLNCMIYAMQREHVAEFCVFNGKYGYPGVLEDGTEDLVKEFEQAIYGPPPEGFFPDYPLGFAKGLPGPEEAGVNGPSWLSYPPNALLYAARHDLVLLNDNARLPVLGLSTDFKANAKALSTALALEAVTLALPPLPSLSFPQVAELRAETRNEVRPFRRAMLKLSKDLNAALLSDSTLLDVQKEARFIVETTIVPELTELREALAAPQRPWHRRAVDLAKSVPELVGNFATLPASMATARLLARIGSMLADVRDDQLAASGIAKRGGLHFLLKIQDRGGLR